MKQLHLLLVDTFGKPMEQALKIMFKQKAEGALQEMGFAGRAAMVQGLEVTLLPVVSKAHGPQIRHSDNDTDLLFDMSGGPKVLQVHTFTCCWAKRKIWLQMRKCFSKSSTMMTTADMAMREDPSSKKYQNAFTRIRTNLQTLCKLAWVIAQR